MSLHELIRFFLRTVEDGDFGAVSGRIARNVRAHGSKPDDSELKLR